MTAHKIKVLNLYAGVGGNRRLWGDGYEVTAVEFDPNIAAAYAQLYPNDTVVTGDAHEYLRQHFAEFDFIWASPPCPTHGQLRFRTQVLSGRSEPVFPDMKLYEEVIFLKHHATPSTLGPGGEPVKWLVENVVPYYEPLIPATKLNRHLYWSNYQLPSTLPGHARKNLAELTVAEWQELHDIDLTPFPLTGKRQILRNCVAPADGLALIQAAFA